MKSIQIIFSAIFMMAFSLSALQMHSFCGFYVAKTDTKLFNDKSEVIYVRDGERSVITMSNDFKGSVKDFAMVVPVPVVLKEKDIRIVNRDIFDKLNAYSAPRLVEYYDNNPCQPVYFDEKVEDFAPADNESIPMVSKLEFKDKNYGVTIEAEYKIGEYDILILSALESSGLKKWLINNDYKIPSGAEEVLDPYIKNNLKFFVVKVNLEEFDKSQAEFLNPIQIEYSSDRFMLPIRLGMANSKGAQDMIVYAFTRTGRVECTNYRTSQLPTGKNIPLFVQEKFDKFYLDLFNKNYKTEGKNAVFLEYAWDVTPNGGIKCDPCVAPAPIFSDFKKAGVNWANDMSRKSQVFFTRLHVRYSRDKFPQDLFFQTTPNTERFQCRYILTHPATGDLSCEEGQNYLQDLERRRKKEIDELTALTGWDNKFSNNYIKEYSNRIKDQKKQGTSPLIPVGNGPSWPTTIIIVMAIISMTTLSIWSAKHLFKLKV